MSYKVFISSTKKDIDLARDVAARLKDAGVAVLSAEEEHAGSQSIATAIERGLKDSDEVMVLMTDDSIRSPWIMYEVGAAFSLHKRVTPIVVGVRPADLPPMFKRLRHVKYSDLRTYISSLRKRRTATAKRHAGR